MTGYNTPLTKKKMLIERLDVDFVLKAVRLGIWELDPITGLVDWDDRCQELFGVVGENQLTYEQVISHIHPADADRVDLAIRQWLNTLKEGVHDTTFRIIGTTNSTLRWIRFAGQSYVNEAGGLYRLAGIAQDITESVLDRQKSEQSDIRIQQMIEQTPVAMLVAKGPDLVVETINQAMQTLLNQQPEILKKTVLRAIPELSAQPIINILQQVYQTGESYNGWAIEIPLYREGELETGYFNLTCTPYYEGNVMTGVMQVATEVTSQVNSAKKLEASETRFQDLIAKAPFAIAVYITREFIIDMANDAMIKVWGKSPAVIGMALADALPELEGQPFIGLLEQVFDTGILYQTNEQQVNLMTDGHLQTYWFTFTYQPLTTDQGQVYAVLNMAVDVTERVVNRQRIEESQQQLLASFEQSPVAIAIIDATDLTFRMANPFYGELVGRMPDELVGKPMLEALPEFKGQGFDQILREVIDTGLPFMAAEIAVKVIRNSQLETIYVHLTYQPQYGPDPNVIAAGAVSGVLVVATDITQQVLARKKLEEAETALRGAIELAQLATWSLDIERGVISYSERFMKWLGFLENTKDSNEAYNPIPDEHRQSVTDAIASVIRPGSSGLYENEHPIINQFTGQVRIIHAQAQVFYDAAGKPAVLRGTAQDITSQRQVQSALEQQVQERTEELESTNEELAAINEEYAATNEKLTESNQMLIRSNDNLQQFAYVASHDLQEPLRKVQQFGDLLKTQYASQLGEGIGYLERMQAAASRMSILIRDLLSFSRIPTQQDSVVSISLNAIVSTVLNDLELRLQETHAVVEVKSLPKIQGDRTQLEQLFQNLLSNALKFRRSDRFGDPVPPLIQISCQVVTAIELPSSVKPTRASRNYFCINISDNGIGFEQKYVDRIFQVFQRLHNKSEFAGTGIGLAICEKVAANHGGAITANSQHGQGATFQLYLPAPDNI